ncbi:MAG: FeoA family protein [Aureliella sp.]
MLSLANISPGETVTVAEITGDDSISARLLEMGIIDGEQITLVGRAPMGDPLEISLRGYRLSLRSAEAERVLVANDAGNGNG